ncbi:unnamed protein product [Caenorhabditis bovis]|uniref:Protein kinase domain-containing protein n=1 Tax=Caenorhabditis bovis TaxID=2654633 RepID=A0A8S1EMV1_9PELO|nr:unnamed protein product [Caenorhabditis bovis]
MPSKQAGFHRVLDGLAKRQLQHDFQLERAAETYEPVRNIGSGAFGIVCEAIETSSKDKVAIKKIGHASATPTLARRTLREIRVLRFIDHPNIVNLRDIFRTKGPLGTDVYLVMDLMEGNLHHLIYGEPEPLDENLIVDFLVQLLRGLQYLHAASIAHRDLKPSNLLVNSDGVLRIADFGMAKLAEVERRTDDPDEHCFYMTQHVATLPYRAPELLFVMPEHSTAVDMWAVGCIFAEMVLKRELFGGRSVQNQIKFLLQVFGRPSQKIIDKIRCDRTKKLIEDFSLEVDLTWEELLFCKTRGNNQIFFDCCEAVDFIKKLLRVDAFERMKVNEAVTHPYIKRFYTENTKQPTCPFKVKRDMAMVENLDHEQLSEVLCNDVKSAENHYQEFNTTGSTGSDHSAETSSCESNSFPQLDMQDVAIQLSSISDFREMSS